jgi:hypothetical protein
MNESKIINNFSNWLASQFKFKGILNMFKGTLFSFVVKQGFQRVPDNNTEDVLKVMRAVSSGNYGTLSKDVIKRASKALKTPISNVKERIIMNGIVDIIFKLIKA